MQRLLPDSGESRSSGSSQSESQIGDIGVTTSVPEMYLGDCGVNPKAKQLEVLQQLPPIQATPSISGRLNGIDSKFGWLRGLAML